MKKIIALLFCTTILLAGCGSSNKTVDLTTTPDTEKIAEFQKEDTETEIPKSIDSNVDVILTMMSFDDSQTIDDYIVELQKSNPDSIYSVYDDSHYVMTIKDSERKAALEQFKDKSYIETTFQEIFNDEQYNGAFVSMDYDDNFENVTFYADKEKYNNAGLAVSFGPVITSGMFSDLIQAYNLIDVNNRTCHVQIIDNDTKELIYDSDSFEDTTE